MSAMTIDSTLTRIEANLDVCDALAAYLDVWTARLLAESGEQ